jgi:hypothetical protein
LQSYQCSIHAGNKLKQAQLLTVPNQRNYRLFYVNH